MFSTVPIHSPNCISRFYGPIKLNIQLVCHDLIRKWVKLSLFLNLLPLANRV